MIFLRFCGGVICPDKLLSWKYGYHHVSLEYGCRTGCPVGGRVWWGFFAGVCGIFGSISMADISLIEERLMWGTVARDLWYSRSVFCRTSNALIVGGLECSIVIFSEATLPLVLIWVYCYWCACQVVGAYVSLTRRRVCILMYVYVCLLIMFMCRECGMSVYVLTADWCLFS